MFDCSFCGASFFNSKRSRASHYKGCVNFQSDKLSKLKQFEIQKINFKFKCDSCYFKFESNRQLSAHKSQCELYQKNVNSKLEFYKDEIIKLYNYNSANFIAQKLNKKEHFNLFSASLIINLLQKNNIKTNTIKESANLESTRNLYVKTCLEKYGGENVLSKNTEPFLKRNNTILEKYGVSNVFAAVEFKDSIIKNDEYWISNYGVNKKELWSKNSASQWSSLTSQDRKIEGLRRFELGKINYEARTGKSYDKYVSEIRKKWWNNATKEEKHNRCKKWINTNPTRSSLEILIEEILKEAEIDFISQYHIIDDNGQNYFFDFKIGNTLIEINGDYWHANPKIYNHDDIISYPNRVLKTAQEIWDKDKNKYEKSKCDEDICDIIYIWEYEIHNDIIAVIDKLLKLKEYDEDIKN